MIGERRPLLQAVAHLVGRAGGGDGVDHLVADRGRHRFPVAFPERGRDLLADRLPAARLEHRVVEPRRVVEGDLRAGLAPRLLAVVGDRGDDVDRRLALGACELGQHDVLDVLARVDGMADQAVGLGGGGADHAAVDRGDVDRDGRSRHGRAPVLRNRDVVVLAFEAEPAALARGERRAHQPHRLAHARRRRMLERHRVPLLVHRSGAGAEAEDHAAARHLVDVHRRRGGEHRRAHEGVGDAGAELDALGLRGDRGEAHEAMLVEELGDPHRVEAARFGEAGGVDLVLDALAGEDQSVARHRMVPRAATAAAIRMTSIFRVAPARFTTSLTAHRPMLRSSRYVLTRKRCPSAHTS